MTSSSHATTRPDRNTIIMDDAGGGNILGGIVIGAICGNGYRSRVIGPEWFVVGPGIKPMIASTVLELVRAFGSPPHVVLCRSDLFDQAHRDLARLGFRVERAIINGSLNDRAEEDFFRHLCEMGLPEYIMTMFPGEGKDKGRCYRALNDFCMRFLMADFASRRFMAKGNTRKFLEIAEAVVERKFVHRIRGPRSKLCVECGRRISGEAWFCTCGTCSFYIHAECASWEQPAEVEPVRDISDIVAEMARQ